MRQITLNIFEHSTFITPPTYFKNNNSINYYKYDIFHIQRGIFLTAIKFF